MSFSFLIRPLIFILPIHRSCMFMYHVIIVAVYSALPMWLLPEPVNGSSLITICRELVGWVQGFGAHRKDFGSIVTCLSGFLSSLSTALLPVCMDSGI